MDIKTFKRIRNLPVKEGKLKLGEYYEPLVKYNLDADQLADQLGPVFGSALREGNIKVSLKKLTEFMIRFLK